MQSFVGTAISGDIRRILGDTTEGSYVFSDADLIAAINAAIRALFRDAPEASYTSPVAFDDDVTITALSDTITIDWRYKDALIHYASAHCFYSDSRDTSNIERGDNEMKLYRQAL